VPWPRAGTTPGHRRSIRYPPAAMEGPAVIERLAGGLVLRRAAAADVEALVAFNAAVHGAPGPPDRSVGVWTRDLLTRPHPTFGAGGFLGVGDPPAGELVSPPHPLPPTWGHRGGPLGGGAGGVVGGPPAGAGRGRA